MFYFRARYPCGNDIDKVAFILFIKPFFIINLGKFIYRLCRGNQLAFKLECSEYETERYVTLPVVKN